jgi:hypothetical protein
MLQTVTKNGNPSSKSEEMGKGVKDPRLGYIALGGTIQYAYSREVRRIFNMVCRLEYETDI